MATWSSSYVTSLPDSAFACPEQRKYPHHSSSGSLDLPHLRAALSRIGDPDNEQCGKAHLQAHAKEAGMGKALLPVKAQPFDPDEMEAWFAGRTPRRLLAIPFGGPIASPKTPLGVDLDGEWFDAKTDIFAGVKALIDSRERLLDWHHGHDDLMRRTVIGKTMLDPDPDEDGWWVEAWLKAGQKHLEMVKRLVERGAQLFGSSEAARKSVDDDGHISEWPMVLETLTTRPINTLSVLRPWKAADLNDSGISNAAILSLLGDLDALGAELPRSFRVGGGDEAVEAKGVSIQDALGSWESLRDSLRNQP